MALKLNYTMKNGISVNNAYAKIVSAGTDKKWANIKVAYFVDKTQTIPFHQHEYIFKPDMTDKGVNLWKQGYAHLKTLDDFAGAVDVLEDGQQA